MDEQSRDGGNEWLDMQRLGQLYERSIALSETYMLWIETFYNTNELCRRALLAFNGAEPVGSGKRQHINFKNNRDTWDQATDCEILGALLQNYREQLKDSRWLPAFYTEEVDARFHGDCMAYARYLFNKSALIKKGRVYPNKKSFMKDPGVKFGFQLTELLQQFHIEFAAFMGEIEQQERLLCQAKLRMEQDMPHYSDANFTMRLSYGQVRQYTLGGRPSGYFTASPSIVRKMQQGIEGVEDYHVEPEMLTLLSGPEFAPYADHRTGQLQLCFLTTNDITGGNSGSPMFDGQNRLIGLAFDGNWDSLSSDIFFDSQLARCIGVDIRYVLFMMDRWGHADRLLREIGISTAGI
jgi:hypothetical protein